MDIAQKLAGIRDLMKKEGLDAYIVANTDPHNNEYVAPRWTSRQWLSGLQGSAGTVVVTAAWAGLWTDGRYYVAAEMALGGTEIELMRASDPGVLPIDEWLKANLADGNKVGLCGAETSVLQVRSWRDSLTNSGLELLTDYDLVNKLWSDRPAAPCGHLYLVDDSYAGQSVEEKVARVRAEMKKAKVSAYLLGRTDESCWLLNFRGTDIEAAPTVYAWTLVTETDVELFIDEGKLTAEAQAKFEANGVTVRAYEEVGEALNFLDESTRLLIVPNHLNEAVYQRIQKAKCVEGKPIITHLKAVKNEVEIEHTKNALLKDGTALVRFYVWLYRSLNMGEKVTELSASRKLEAFRAEEEGFRHNSFTAIMGYAADGALNHYSVDEKSDKPVRLENLFLIDSGGNFVDGTTDTTRVIPMGEPTEIQKEDYTLVLRSLIELITCEFAEGTTGAQLDGICRFSLWQTGRDFKHGTGHGVGFGLEVHEGPQSISSRGAEPITLGMVSTIEPGCYRPGEFGIRLENMVHTVLSRETEFGRFFRFENLTYCPFNVDLIEPSLLLAEQLKWVNAYNAEVFEKLSPRLRDEAEVTWLRHECRPIEYGIEEPANGE